MTTPAIQSTLVVVGTNQPVTGLREGLQSSIAESLGTSSDQVSVSEPVPTLAALLDHGDIGTARRLEESKSKPRRNQAGMDMAPALQVDFEVFVPEDGSSGSSESARRSRSNATTVSMLDAMLEAVKSIRSNPGPLLLSVVSKLASQGINLTANFTRPLQARVAMPQKQVFSARSVAGAWGFCGGEAACTDEVNLLRYREVMCVDGLNISKQVSLSLCSTMEMPHSSEPCPTDSPRPPTCGWRTGNWSPCVSTLLPKDKLQALREDLCNASGLGKQYREVYCLMETGRKSAWPETEGCIKRHGPELSSERQCHCVASKDSGSSRGSWSAAQAKQDDGTDAAGEEGLQTTAPVALGALGPLMAVALCLAGSMLAVLGCCYFRGRKKLIQKTEKIAPEPDAQAMAVRGSPRASSAAASASVRRKQLDVPQVPASPAASAKSPMSVASQSTKSPSAISSAVSQSPKASRNSKNEGSAAIRSQSCEGNESEGSGSEAMGSLRAIMARRPRPSALGNDIGDKTTGPGQRGSARRALQAWSNSQQTRQPAGGIKNLSQTGTQRPGSLHSSAAHASSQATQRSGTQAGNKVATPQGEQATINPWAPHPNSMPPTIR